MALDPTQLAEATAALTAELRTADACAPDWSPADQFRFVATRPPKRVLQSTIESRLIRDRRPSPPLLGLLFGPGDFETKLREADAYAATADFLAANDPQDGHRGGGEADQDQH